MNFQSEVSAPILSGEASDPPEAVCPGPPWFPSGLLPGDERPPKNTEPFTGAPDFRAALTPGASFATAPPEAPIMSFGALQSTSEEKLHHATFSSRPGWIVRFAFLGAIGIHETTWLAGALLDVDAPIESNVCYGIVTARALRKMELVPADVEQFFESGAACEITLRVEPLPKCLVSLAPLTPVETYSVGPQFASLDRLNARREQRAEFARRRECGVALRRRWDISTMTCRSALPCWIPAFAVEEIKRSRQWLSCPPPLPAMVSPAPRLSGGEVPSVVRLERGVVEDGPRKLRGGFVDS